MIFDPKREASETPSTASISMARVTRCTYCLQLNAYKHKNQISES